MSLIYPLSFSTCVAQVSATSPIIRIDEILKVDEKTTEECTGFLWSLWAHQKMFQCPWSFADRNGFCNARMTTTMWRKTCRRVVEPMASLWWWLGYNSSTILCCFLEPFWTPRWLLWSQSMQRAMLPWSQATRPLNPAALFLLISLVDWEETSKTASGLKHGRQVMSTCSALQPTKPQTSWEQWAIASTMAGCERWMVNHGFPLFSYGFYGFIGFSYENH